MVIISGDLAFVPSECFLDVPHEVSECRVLRYALAYPLARNVVLKNLNTFSMTRNELFEDITSLCFSIY